MPDRLWSALDFCYNQSSAISFLIWAMNHFPCHGKCCTVITIINHTIVEQISKVCQLLQNWFDGVLLFFVTISNEIRNRKQCLNFAPQCNWIGAQNPIPPSFYSCRLPINGKTPLGYLIALTFEFGFAYSAACCGFLIMSFFIGSAWLTIVFIRDITNDLNALHSVSATSHKNKCLELKKHFCRTIRFYSDAKQLSVIPDSSLFL